MTSSPIIEREVRIAARPETVFALLSDADRMNEWMGRSVLADVRPGGVLRVDYNGFDVMRGAFVEVVPHSRLVFTWGWESLEAASTRPEGSRVEITLRPDGDGTLLHLLHTGLQAMEIESHSAGWEFFLSRLTSVATGEVVGPPYPPLNTAEEAASALNSLLIELVAFVESCPPERWTAVAAGDGRAVNTIAHHVVGHAGLAHFVAATAAGERSPIADLTAEALDQVNATRAIEDAGITREAVIAAARERGPAAVETLRAVPPETLVNTQPMRFANGAELSANMLIAGPLLGDMRHHLDVLHAAVAPAPTAS